jgi:hypothetical protein
MASTRKTYLKEYYQAHKEQFAEANRKFRKNHPGYSRKYQEQQTEYKRGWYDRNREKWNEYIKEYRKKKQES